MNKNNYAIIMAGGVGTRFWPKSKKSLPKQFIDILNTGETLIQSTFKRLSNCVRAENIYVVTNNNYAQLCICLLYTSPSPRDSRVSRMPSSA